MTKTNYNIRVEHLSGTQGLAKHTEKQMEWKHPVAPEPEGQAAGSYSVAQGDLGGGHGKEARQENVRGDLLDEKLVTILCKKN